MAWREIGMVSLKCRYWARGLALAQRGYARVPLAQRVGRVHSARAPEGHAEGWGSRFRFPPQQGESPSQWTVGSGGVPPSSGCESQPDPFLFDSKSVNTRRTGKGPGAKLPAKALGECVFPFASSEKEKAEGVALMRDSARSERNRMVVLSIF